MATSGTIGQTVVDTAVLIEHALRRCKVLPSAQTPETIQIAKDNLYFLMLNIGNRGLNLWAVDNVLLGLNNGRAQYATPHGTLDVLSIVYSQPTLVESLFTSTPTGGYAECPAATKVLRVGIKLAAMYYGAVLIEGSVDGVTFEPLLTTGITTLATAAYNWFALPVLSTLRAVRISSASNPAQPLIATDLVLASATYDLPLAPWNRDTYAALNNKSQLGRPSTNYLFEKKLTPTVTVWPLPNNDLDHLSLYVHRQSQDVGALTDQIEIPQRWMDSIIWLLAARLCFELPSVDSATAQLVVSMADKQELEVEQSETDGMPIYLQPNIGCYSR